MVTRIDAALEPCASCGTPYRARLTRGECPVCGWRVEGPRAARWARFADGLDVAGVVAVTALNLMLLVVLLLVVNHR